MRRLLTIVPVLFAIIPFAAAQDANITAMEYYIDSDPGTGNAIAIPITTGTSPDVDFTIGTASLAPGFHALVIRAEDENGQWSIQESRAFFVSISSITAVTDITAMEYFIDTDPGVGNGASVALTPSPSLDFVTNIPTATLSPGFHVIHLRSMDSDGTWGIRESRAFFVSAENLVSQSAITNMEYFIDNDPGYGNGTAVSVTSASNLDVQTLIPTGTLAPGFHKLHIRAKDDDGIWGMSESRSFFVDRSGYITDVEYYFDTDPGVGSATQQIVSPEEFNIDIDLNIPTTSLSDGLHSLGMRVRRTDGVWSEAQTADFTICSFPDAGFAASTACAGDATSFTDNSITQPGDLYQWDFDGDGTADATTTGDVTFAYPASGTYAAMLVIDRSGCKDTAGVVVNVEAVPVASAGTDQDICADNTTLSAAAPNPGETGNWTFVNGTGTLADAASETTAVTGIGTYSNTLQWTLINIAAGCSDSDTVIINSNQPITALPLDATAALGQTSNVNVQSIAAINPGDVLNTTVVTSPLKGSAAVLPDGTISYTPDNGTVGKDTVVFQLCNQCSKCSSGILVLDILNNAPVITPEPVAVPNGQNVNIDLLAIISDPNNNLDPSTLAITGQPASGAIALIDESYHLIIDYDGIVFSGTDQVTLQVCDFAGICSSNIIFVDVDLPQDPPITVYNAISPNGDAKHDFLEIENIEAYPHNRIYIVNRCGDKVFDAQGYDNAQIKFDGTANANGGKDLPAGTYFYSIDPGNGHSRISGFLVLKR